MQGIALNLLPVLTQDFRITMYVVPSRGDERLVYAGESAVLRRLREGEEYKPYWTLFQAFDGTPCSCSGPLRRKEVRRASLELTPEAAGSGSEGDGPAAQQGLLAKGGAGLGWREVADDHHPLCPRHGLAPRYWVRGTGVGLNQDFRSPH